MNLILHIFHNGDLYEVTVKQNIITRIIKYCGEAQLPRETEFQALPSEVRGKIVDAFRKKYQHDEED